MIVHGHDLPDADLEAALKTLGNGAFALRDLQAAIEAAGIDPLTIPQFIQTCQSGGRF